MFLETDRVGILIVEGGHSGSEEAVGSNCGFTLKGFYEIGTFHLVCFANNEPEKVQSSSEAHSESSIPKNSRTSLIISNNEMCFSVRLIIGSITIRWKVIQEDSPRHVRSSAPSCTYNTSVVSS